MSALAATFPGIDRDVAVAGALLHDIGKVETYASRNGAIELTDAGKLLGEIPLGYYRVGATIEHIDGFPRADADALLHIILSHHGKLEHGSPVVPCTREATLVHFIDNLGGNLGSFDRIEKALAEGASWSDFDRGLVDGRLLRRARASARAQAAGGRVRAARPSGAELRRSASALGRSCPRWAARSPTRPCSASTSRPRSSAR